MDKDNKAVMFNFINQTYKSPEGKIILAQLLMNEMYSTRVVSRIVDLDELKELYQESLTDSTIKVDFKFDGNFLKCENVPTRLIEDEELVEEFKGTESTYKPLVCTVYDLFNVLVESEGLLVADELANDVNDNVLDNGVTSFLPVYSQSTMTVYIALKTKEGWKNIKLIYVEDGTIQSGKFTFLIKANRAKRLEEFPVTYLRDIEFNGETFKLYRLEERMLTLAFDADNVGLFPSIVNRYVFTSELYKQILSAINLINARTIEGLYGEKAKEDTANNSENYRSRYTNSYVTYKLRYTTLKTKDIEYFIMDCLQNVVPKVYRKEMDNEGLIAHITSLNLPTISKLVYTTICKIMINGGPNAKDRLVYARSLMNMYKCKKYKIDTYLYMTRVRMFLIPMNLEYGNQEILRGSDAPYTTLLERKE